CYHAVSLLARNTGVRVLLQGQGGDELFWGYPWVRRAVSRTLLRMALWHEGLPAFRRYLQAVSAPRRPTAGESPTSCSSGSLAAFLAAAMCATSLFVQDLRIPRGQFAFYDLDPDFQRAHVQMHRYYGEALGSARARSPATQLFTLPLPREDVALDMMR